MSPDPKEFGVLKSDSWGTDFVEQVAPQHDEISLWKRRVSAFYGTELDLLLRVLGIKIIYLAGVSTDIAVEATAREAHDRDYIVRVLANCCAAANGVDHENSLSMVSKISDVIT